MDSLGWLLCWLLTELADWRSFLKLHSHVAISLRVSLRWMVEWGKQTGLCGFFLNHSLSVWRKHTCLLIYSKNSGSIGILQNELIIIPALSCHCKLCLLFFVVKILLFFKVALRNFFFFETPKFITYCQSVTHSDKCLKYPLLRISCFSKLIIFVDISVLSA